jgi:ketosteroid isomerase-like protein
MSKDLIRRLYSEGFNRRDAAAAAAFYAEDAVNHGRQVGRDGMRKVFEALFSAFPDFRYEILEETEEGERIVCKVRMTGTHRGQPALPEAFSGMLAGVARPPPGLKRGCKVQGPRCSSHRWFQVRHGVVP